MGIKKRYVKSSGVCKCTFRLPKEAAKEANQVNIVGEFNDWSTNSLPMQKLKTGEFKLEVTLEPGKNYQFRYLIDNNVWENDWDADGYQHVQGLPVENSVVTV